MNGDKRRRESKRETQTNKVPPTSTPQPPEPAPGYSPQPPSQPARPQAPLSPKPRMDFRQNLRLSVILFPSPFPPSSPLRIPFFPSLPFPSLHIQASFAGHSPVPLPSPRRSHSPPPQLLRNSSITVQSFVNF